MENDNDINTNYEDKHLEDMNFKEKKRRKGKWLIVVICIVIATNFATGAAVWAINRKEIKLVDENTFDELYKVKNTIDEYYVDGYDKSKVLEGAIKGMVTALGDPYTVYMNESELSDWNKDVSGKYTGIGIQIGANKETDEVVVISPFKGAPADRAGIKSGDVLVKVNDLSVTKETLNDALTIMKTKAGDKVNLVLKRDGKEYDKTIVTEEIQIQTVFSEMLDSGIGYIQLTMFDEDCSEPFAEALKDLKAKNAKGIIVDLRGNPGGYVNECVKITSNFIPKGEVIVYTEDKAKNQTKYKSEGGKYTDIPLVVLVDGGSASASEIFSGAVRDHNRATLIGDKTFGKGKVQVVLNDNLLGTNDGSGLKVTISYYYTPKGENIDKKGIHPEVEIKYDNAFKNTTYSKEKDNQLNKAIEVMKEKLSK
ncbi:C-terminal processing peptidase-3. Serine peptidase. MEROPS family S41A [Hathewaya proteolytica DSM 3090]|uniref:C-terminal processing peptidase-3. Serine peptidase. MEROPS family S41A n=1 Tax=Hathewaya proteolytica DSM 3090 TaxID=1121331 RepID=A0A1M6NFR3_9CLOT|nr:S41 family peptidase [Hathewaya proteolytica]SHJ94492.1 C-terminal processing peptidase-3. Serine peptidase. MEROPS family S41A [Hathewaya proteolytica DSM 3090]